MVLSGTLREFILADVFHLLNQQKITGKLFLCDGQAEGAIIFKDGLISGAEKNDETLQNKLFNYLVDVKKKLPEHLNVLFTSHEGSLNSLCTNLIERNLISTKELKTFSSTCVEDIVCSLLIWKSGSYRFNSLRTVDPLICSSVSIPTETIIMEGMRRVDEWNRMIDKINDESIFVKVDINPAEITEPDIFNRPEEYIYHRLDGSTTIANIVRACCLSEYKVYETINILLKAERILSLSPRISQSIQAAIDRKEQETTTSGTKILLSTLLALGIAAFIFLLGFSIKNFFLSDIKAKACRERSDSFFLQTQDKTENASLLYHALTGIKNHQLGDLQKAGFILWQDLSPNNCFKD